MNSIVTIPEQRPNVGNTTESLLETNLTERLYSNSPDLEQISRALGSIEKQPVLNPSLSPEQSISIEALQARDPDEWNSFLKRVEPWLDKLTANLASKYGKPNDAEDVKQEIILRLYKNIDNYPSFQPPGWDEMLLTTMARNLFKDKIKVMSSRLTDYLDDPEQTTAEVPDFASEVVEGIVSKDQFQKIMQGLSPSDKKVLIMKYCLDYSLEEIARSEGISKTGALKTKLHRARTHARELNTIS